MADHPLKYLGSQIQLAPGCRLRSFFHLFMQYGIFTQLSDHFPLLRAQYDQCPENDCLWPQFINLQFSKTVEMIGFPGQPRLEMYHSLLGMDGETAHEIRQLPLAVLLDMPLALGPLSHMVFGDRMDTMVFETVYTLFEFIDGMAWTLSFHGTPSHCRTGG